MEIINQPNTPFLSDITVGNYIVPGIWGSIDPDHIIKIGVLDDLNSFSGEHSENGALLAAKEINMAGGIEINGTIHYIGIASENTDEGNPVLDISKAVSAAETMVSYNPHFIIGGHRTEALQEYIEVIMDAQIPFIGTGATDEYFCQNVLTNYARYKYFFRVMPINSSSMGSELIKFLMSIGPLINTTYGEEFRNVAIIRENLDWTEPLRDALFNYLQNNPIWNYTIVSDIPYPIGATQEDFETIWSDIQDSGANITVPLISGPGGIYMMKQYASQQPNCLVSGIDIISQMNTFWNDTDGDCKYEVLMQLYRTNKTDLTIPFWNAYQDEYDKEPFYTGVGAYDAVRLLVDAVNNSQSLNADIIVSSLESNTKSNPFLGASGNIAFTSSHDLFEGWPYGTNTFCQWQLDGLKAVVPSSNLIYPDNIATGTILLPHWVITPLSNPEDFSLSSNAENPEINGDFNLIWTKSQGADIYSLYSSDSPKPSIGQNLKLITHQHDNSPYEMTNLKTGDYYFIVIAYNNTGASISNSIYVNVSRPSPGPFSLISDAQNPDTDGTFNLSWTPSEGADNYSIYRYTTPITEINESLKIISYQNAISPFLITERENDIYYYIVQAVNATGKTLSNSIFVNVSVLPEDFILTSTGKDPDLYGDFWLNWTISANAHNYSVYRHTNLITEINGSLTLLADEITDLSLAQNNYLEGTYYFLVVAHNDYGDTLSNCIKVGIDISETITLINPDSSTSWIRGSPQNISWTSSGNISNLRIEIYNNDVFVMEIVSNTPNDGIFEWIIPDLATSTNYRIKIIDTVNSSIFDYSEYFEIKEPTASPDIPGYDLILLFGTVSVIVILSTKKKLIKLR